jgi:hypothetical protein
LVQVPDVRVTTFPEAVIVGLVDTAGVKPAVCVFDAGLLEDSPLALLA